MLFKWKMQLRFMAHFLYILPFSKYLVLLLFQLLLYPIIKAQGPLLEIEAVMKGTALLPCDIRPPITDDEATLVLWYKEEETPIYSFDNRGKISEAGSHWKDNTIFGSRAFFRTMSNPATLSLDDVQMDDQGHYRCRVDFVHSPTKNQRIYLKIIVPPSEPVILNENDEIITTGETKPYKEGDTAKLTCRTTGGRPKPVVRWWKGETLLESNNISTIDNNTTATVVYITNLDRFYHRTTYTCQAINNNITVPVHKTITLNMFLRPLIAIISNVGQTQLSVGRKYELQCQAFGSVPPAQITWRRDDQMIPNPQTKVSTDNNSTTSVLTFVPQMEDDGKRIHCIAVNPIVKTWKEETSLKLDVAYPPIVALRLGSEMNANDIEEGDDIYFECIVQANPQAYKIVWRHNDVQIPQTLKQEILVNEKTLVLRSVKKKWNGNYSCTASNVEGDKISNVVKLTVSYKPTCKSNQKMIYGAARNEDIQIICEVDASPQPKEFKWSFNHSREPIPDKKYNVVDKRRGISILTYTPVTEMDFGFLTCLAVNSVGEQDVPCIFQIILAGPPQIPINCSIGNVTTVSLEVSCMEGFDGGLSQHFVLEVINTTTGNVIMNSSFERPSFKLSRLTPGNSLHIRIYAVNSKGRSSAFLLEATTLKAEKQTGYQGSLELAPFVLLTLCALVVVTMLFIFLVRWTAISFCKNRRHRSTALSTKDKTAHHTTLLHNGDREDKNPDLIPVDKKTGYQVLKSDLHDDLNIIADEDNKEQNNHIFVNIADTQLINGSIPGQRKNDVIAEYDGNKSEDGIS